MEGKMNFSQRIGLEPEQKILQIDSMDDDLRMKIHNAIRRYEQYLVYDNQDYIKSDTYQALWCNFFNWDLDIFEDNYLIEVMDDIKKMYLSLPWNKVYDFIEFYIKESNMPSVYVNELNSVLESENSAYRIVGNNIVEITNSEELSEISEACHTGQKAIDHHMKKAIELFSNRETKDYANVVKEAISAVEAAVNIVNGTEGKTLGDALKELNNKHTIHPALSDAFQKIYGYTSDKHTGTRHAIFDGATCIPDFADAKFMLVACSAFVNYLMQRNN
jgi:hypothetical protein